MTREDRDILIADLCGRLPYGVMVKAIGWDAEKNQDVEVAVRVYSVNTDGHVEFGINDYDIEEYLVDDCKPYLRPMSSMTEEEKKDLLITIVGNKGSKYFRVLQDGSIDNTDETIQDLNKFNMHWINFDKDTVTLYLDWLNKKMFDYRGLIPKELANEAPEDIYKI